ncbi:protein kinase subdomain-containing protein PKL [Paxillus ammoniavirescens]|nr:protein kinase subdomain-containing protein PKL [Paxillus ammoniavirescens]
MILRLIPTTWKASIYKACISSPRIATSPQFNIYRLPFGLALKTRTDYPNVEAAALQFVNTLHGIHTPHFIDTAFDGEVTFLLTNWVEGDCVAGEVWERMTSEDWKRLEEQLRLQFYSLRLQTQTSIKHQIICNASGGPIGDPRVPWVKYDNPRTFSSCQEFSAEVWIDLDSTIDGITLRPLLQPLIDRDDVPIVFSHGDLLEKNVILPGGLHRWRSSGEMACILDWELAGWMPNFWDALKATWMCFEDDDVWLNLSRHVFPECDEELTADWEWRNRTRVTIV